MNQPFSIFRASHLEKHLQRKPSLVEWAITQAMWSEHCSYKSSLYFLKLLPKNSDHLLIGPGENAGVIQIHPDLALVFKIESHNHPTAIMAYQGSATGVGGILRDIFAMGARPIALLNSIHCHLSSKKNKVFLDSIVEGIGDYGNSVGIPTIGGEMEFYPWYQENPLVNVACIGKIHPKNITLSSTAKTEDYLLYFGNKTGRDGLGGAVFASSSLSKDREKQKRAIQIADPFMGKMILEATLELIEKGVVSSMQDMGASGLICSVSETAYKSNLGVILDLNQIPLRVSKMKSEEILLSESQERMLASVSKEKKAKAEEILKKYSLSFSWIGQFNRSSLIEIYHHKKQKVKMPLKVLVDGFHSVDYSTMMEEISKIPPLVNCSPLKITLKDLFQVFTLLPSCSSKKEIFEQFDSQITGASLVQPAKGIHLLYDFESKTTIAIAIQGRSHWMKKNSFYGTLATLALLWRSSFVGGSKPLGISNCLNFPSPEKKSTTLEFGRTILAMKKFSQHFSIPITGGNVSFYNESKSSAIVPTPVFVAVGESILEKPPLFPWSKGTLYKTGSLALEKGEVFFQFLLQNKQSLTYSQVPKIDLKKEEQLGLQIIKILEKYSPNLWIREIGRGGIFKRILENLPLGLDVFLSLSSKEKKNWKDILLGEGEESYLFFLPENKVKYLEPYLLSKLFNHSFRALGTIQNGSSILHLGKEKKIPLKPFYEAYNQFF